MRILKTISLIPISFLLFGCSPEASANDRLGLKCSGEVRLSTGSEASPSEEHYTIDRTEGKLILRDAYTGEPITIYKLTISPRQYRGERQEEGRTNGGFPVHHYETVYISREDGSMTSTSLSTTSFPNGSSTTEIGFVGQCEPESPDQTKALKL